MPEINAFFYYQVVFDYSCAKNAYDAAFVQD